MALQENLAKVKEQITKAAREAGRNPDEVLLIAVSKTKPLSMIEEAISCGAMDFGENRPQELAEKAAQLPDVRFHQIGQLQRNKVKYIIDKTALIHSVDSLSLAMEIEKQATKKEKVQDILVQVNISGEESKSGIAPDTAVEFCKQVSELSHVRICGLMTISVAGATEEENFRIFSALRELAHTIEEEKISGVSMKELSMGMTHDFETAIKAGATMVRVGSGIFGARDYMK